MYVCLCNGITEQQIQHAVDGGVSSVNELSKRLGVASNCGSCASMAEEIVEECLAQPAEPLCADLSYPVPA